MSWRDTLLGLVQSLKHASLVTLLLSRDFRSPRLCVWVTPSIFTLEVTLCMDCYPIVGQNCLHVLSLGENSSDQAVKLNSISSTIISNFAQFQSYRHRPREADKVRIVGVQAAASNG